MSKKFDNLVNRVMKEVNYEMSRQVNEDKDKEDLIYEATRRVIKLGRTSWLYKQILKKVKEILRIT